MSLCLACYGEHEPDPCPWCGEETGCVGGLEAHISEPCAPYLAEQGG